MQFHNQKPVEVAAEVLSIMEKHLSQGRSYLEITAGVNIACRLFALPNDLRPETQVETESFSKRQESLA